MTVRQSYIVERLRPTRRDAANTNFVIPTSPGWSEWHVSFNGPESAGYTRKNWKKASFIRDFVRLLWARRWVSLKMEADMRPACCGLPEFITARRCSHLLRCFAGASLTMIKITSFWWCWLVRIWFSIIFVRCIISSAISYARLI